MPTSFFPSSRAKVRLVLSVLAILCLSNGFLFMDSWHRNGESTFIFGENFTLSLLLMLTAIFLLKKR